MNIVFFPILLYQILTVCLDCDEDIVTRWHPLGIEEGLEGSMIEHDFVLSAVAPSFLETFHVCGEETGRCFVRFAVYFLASHTNVELAIEFTH